MFNLSFASTSQLPLSYLQDRIQHVVYEVKDGALQTVTHNSKMPHDKSSQHDANVTPSPLVSSDNNSQLISISYFHILHFH
jgi:hypothetical protein